MTAERTPTSPVVLRTPSETIRMGKDRNGVISDKATPDKDDGAETKPGKSINLPDSGDSGEDTKRRSKSRRKVREASESSDDEKRARRSRKRKSRRRYSSSDDDSDSESEDESGSESDSESVSDGERRKRKERRRKKEKEERRIREKEKEERRIREKERRRRREREEEKKRKKRKKEKKEKGKKGAVTDSWGKCGIIRETDMWNKRPEFTAWLAEVKQVNLEHLPNWEEKQMFKHFTELRSPFLYVPFCRFMEDHNTATFPSKKYYSLDAYYRNKMEKEMKKGMRKVEETERTVFNDEEIRRQEMMRVREKQKEEEVEALKRSMQSGLAQAMKEQAQLREEMAYQYKIGNFEAAAAIQRRLDPDAE